MPTIKNKDLAIIIDNLLNQMVCTTGYSKMRQMLDNKNADARGCVRNSTADGYNKYHLASMFDKTKGSWSNTSKFSHHAYEGGLFDHSVETYQIAMKLWRTLKIVFEEKLTPLMLDAGYTQESIDQWLSDTTDILAIGSYLHDIGKTAMTSQTFHRYGCSLMRMHEQYGYWILGRPWREYNRCFSNQMSAGNNTYKMGMILGLEMACIGHSGYYINDEGILVENCNKYYAEKTLLVPFIIAIADKMSASKNRRSKDFDTYLLEWYGMCSDLKRGTGLFKLVNLGKKPVASDFVGNEIIERDRFAIEYNQQDSKFILDLAW